METVAPQTLENPSVLKERVSNLLRDVMQTVNPKPTDNLVSRLVVMNRKQRRKFYLDNKHRFPNCQSFAHFSWAVQENRFNFT